MVAPLFHTNSTSLLTYFSQAIGNQVGIVALEEYQKQGPGCAPSVKIQLFDEFCLSKNIALALVDFSHDSVSRSDALALFKFLLKIYSVVPKWPQIFNEQPTDFDYNSFVDNCRQLNK